MNRIFSGIQPTGNLHLGNYLGAIRNWVGLQKDNECLFCIVDLHAITVPQDPKALRRDTRLTAATYIASGIDPENSIIFPQSTVSAHAELGWILGCHAPLGWLNRMTQFKDKAGKHRDRASLGLYGYPVLMAADILGYKTTHVPVGEDQKQHLELARDLAQAFNRAYGKEVFIVPEPQILGIAARVMGLRDGTAKMSKSDPSDYSRINLNDNNDEILAKIRKAKTDSEPLPELAEGLNERPEARNLLTIYASLKNITVQQACNEFAGQTFAPFKQALAEVLISEIHPIRERIAQLMEDQAYLDRILLKGAEKAQAIAQETLNEVFDAVGFVRLSR